MKTLLLSLIFLWNFNKNDLNSVKLTITTRIHNGTFVI